MCYDQTSVTFHRRRGHSAFRSAAHARCGGDNASFRNVATLRSRHFLAPKVRIPAGKRQLGALLTWQGALFVHGMASTPN